MTLPDSERSELHHENVASLERLAEVLRTRLGESRYDMWFRDRVQFTIEGATLLVQLKKNVVNRWLQGEYHTHVAIAAQCLTGVTEIRWQLTERQTDSETPPVAPAPAAPQGTAPATSTAAATSTAPARITTPEGGIVTSLPVPAPARVTTPATVPAQFTAPASTSARRLFQWQDFVVGESNKLAHEACRSAATTPNCQYNPIVLYGGVGIGKSHLLQATYVERRKTFPTRTALLLTAENFANSFTAALQTRTLVSFRAKFRGVDALLVDDIEFFDSTRAIQEEFLHTILALTERGAQVVVTADRNPRLLGRLGDSLSSRLGSGLMCRIESPDETERRRILSAKAARLEVVLSSEVLDYVAQRRFRNVREIEGALNCLQAHASVSGQRMTISKAKEILADLERDCVKFVKLPDVEAAVCHFFGLRGKELKSETRVRTISQPRMLAMYLARQHTEAPYTEIGKFFGGRNHSTVMAAERKVQEWLKEDCEIRAGGHTWKMSDLVASLELRLLAG